MSRKRKILIIILVVLLGVFLTSATILVVKFHKEYKEHREFLKQQEELAELKEEIPEDNKEALEENVPEIEETELSFLPEYEQIYAQNNDVIGWLKIEDTNIDYPVMQTMEDEEYYLRKDFYGNYNKNGCLFMDTDSVAGVGKVKFNYSQGSRPSTNLIIYGHTIKTGEMFGKLSQYENKEYGLKHNIICFDTLYEKREYELISVFYTQIFYKHQTVFKYYQFFQADTQEEFDYWYDNIKEMSLYDTGVTAEFGDEFITLSCCAYHVEDGRFVVVGRRKKDENN